MATSLTLVPRIADFVLSESEMFRSRDNITVTQTGDAIASGTVLGKITASGKYIPYLDGASDGSQTAAAILYTPLPAATGDKKAVAFTDDCEVRRGALTGLDAAAEVDLRTHGIKVRGTAGIAGISTPAL